MLNPGAPELLTDALEWELQQLPSVISTQSFAGLSKQLSVGMNEGNPKWYDLPRTQAMLNVFINLSSG